VARKHSFVINESNTKIKSATSVVENVVGITEAVKVDVQGHSCVLELYVINQEDHDLLLGLDWFVATGAQFFPGEGVLRFASEVIFLVLMLIF
jgi:hypothetical protein